MAFGSADSQLLSTPELASQITTNITMDPPNLSKSPQQLSEEPTSLHQFLEILAAEEAAAEAAVAANGDTTADDFPTNPAEQRALVERLIKAMLNTVDIVDNYCNNSMENSEVKFIHSLPRAKLVRKAWEVMVSNQATMNHTAPAMAYTHSSLSQWFNYNVQRGIIHPKAFSAEIPNYMTRLRLSLCTFRSSKAACCDLFTLPMIWRYTCNPVRELEIKVSNNHTNKLKEYCKFLDQVSKFGGSYETVGNVTYVRKSTGEVVATLTRPTKRPLTDFLDDDLAAYARRHRLSMAQLVVFLATIQEESDNEDEAADQEEPDCEEEPDYEEELADRGDCTDDGGWDADKPQADNEHASDDNLGLQEEFLIDQHPHLDALQQPNIRSDEDSASLKIDYDDVDPELEDTQSNVSLTSKGLATAEPSPDHRLSPEHIIRNAADFFQREAAERAAERAAALNGANAGNCDDFPDDDNGQLVLVDQMIEAIDNTDGVIDNDNSDQKAIRELPGDKKEKIAWRAMFKIRDVQRGLHHPDLLTVTFPNYMSRFRATCALVRSSKAAATQFFAVPLFDRFIANPIMELDNKLSNNNTNASKAYNGEVKGAEKNSRTVTKFDNRAEIRDASGELIKILMKPRKRVLSEFLPPDLARSPAAKVKRARGSRRGAGASPTPVASFVTPANGGSPLQNIAAANTLPAIQEDDEPIEASAVQASPADTILDDFHANDQHLKAGQSNDGKNHDDHPRTESINPEHSSPSADQSSSYQKYANYGGMNNTGMDNGYVVNGYIHNMDNAYLDNTRLNNTGPNVAQNNIDQSNAGDVQPPLSFTPYQEEFYPIPNQSAPPNQFEADPGWASLQAGPGSSASITLTPPVDPMLEEYSTDINSYTPTGSGQSGGAMVNQDGNLVQNSAGSDLGGGGGGGRRLRPEEVE
ncbi:unnamed protein product [Sordaria macrospora k-hell]|uniref:WGS project CABT00000000 data, contig 2.62 n=1 Tax=Sordaria macrospora (strain ATCC MYA-333 / DSM 997 / K(L3346) / K-hell) TaxID=771870 RepID=F7WAL0_SORMK|nr:uncharacterized protein SMAC_09473 [Sordaria macrospora k-hell]CCC14205.1 unnamed protein product [Sordaria macrospora k-hell]